MGKTRENLNYSYYCLCLYFCAFLGWFRIHHAGTNFNRTPMGSSHESRANPWFHPENPRLLNYGIWLKLNVARHTQWFVPRAMRPARPWRQHHGSRACSTHFRETELLPALQPPAQAMRSQAGKHAAAGPSAILGEAGSAPPDRMLIALRRRLRLPLPVAPHRCGAHGHGCGADVDAYGDHHAACLRTGLLARRAKPLEHAWVRIAREAVGPEGQIVPQQWLARTSAPGVDPADRRRLDFVAYGATPLGEALCCDVTLVSSRVPADARREAPALCCLA